jgi:hypothetical protein
MQWPNTKDFTATVFHCKSGPIPLLLYGLIVELSLYLINKAPRHEDMGGGSTAPQFLVSRSSRVTHGTHWIGGWVGPRAVWAPWNREKYLATAGNQIPVVLHTAVSTELLNNTVSAT